MSRRACAMDIYAPPGSPEMSFCMRVYSIHLFSSRTYRNWLDEVRILFVLRASMPPWAVARANLRCHLMPGTCQREADLYLDVRCAARRSASYSNRHNKSPWRVLHICSRSILTLLAQHLTASQSPCETARQRCGD